MTVRFLGYDRKKWAKEWFWDGIKINMFLERVLLRVPNVLRNIQNNLAWERLDGIHGHKGEEAALTALKMIQVCRSLSA